VKYFKYPSNSFRGIEFIVIKDLPSEQKKSILKWIKSDDVITISTEKKLYENCVQYTTYSHWFENVFQVELEKTRGITAEQKVEPLKLRPAF